MPGGVIPGAAPETIVSLAGLEQLDGFVLHVNHSCLLLKRGPAYLLCDPWPISPAFGTWTQFPPAPAELIRFILSLDPARLAVVVSHGHDDHLDDFFVSRHLARCRFFVPQFRSLGLARRIEALTGQAPGLLTQTPVTWGRFSLSRVVNDDFTGADALVAIETDAWSVIHANDNWRRQPQGVIEFLAGVKRRCAGPFLYLSRIGIADCFPLSYPQHETLGLPGIAAERIQAAIDAAAANMEALGQERLYAYANQSRVISPHATAPFSGLAATVALLERHNASGGRPISQLMPGDLFIMGREAWPGRVDRPGEDLVLHLLGRLEREANAYIAAPPGCSPRPVRFACLESGERPPERETSDDEGFFAVYAADRVTWQNILTGKITLEAISIGGAGAIFKHPRDFNMRDVHNAVAEFACLAQRRALERGLSWLLDAA